VLKFRRPTNASEFHQLGAEARPFARRCATGSGVHPDWAQYLPITEDVAIACYWVHKLGVDPAWTIPEALALAASCGATVNYLFAQLSQAMATQVVADETEALDALGEDSQPTPSGETT